MRLFMLTLSLIVSAVLAGSTVQIEDGAKYTANLHEGIANHFDAELNKTYECAPLHNYANRFSVCHNTDKNTWIIYVLDGIK